MITFTARSRQVETRIGHRNGNRNPRFSKFVSLFIWAVWKETSHDHPAFSFPFRRPFRVSPFRERAVPWIQGLIDYMYRAIHLLIIRAAGGGGDAHGRQWCVDCMQRFITFTISYLNWFVTFSKNPMKESNERMQWLFRCIESLFHCMQWSIHYIHHMTHCIHHIILHNDLGFRV